jgi:hypothetical protein
LDFQCERRRAGFARLSLCICCMAPKPLLAPLAAVNADRPSSSSRPSQSGAPSGYSAAREGSRNTRLGCKGRLKASRLRRLVKLSAESEKNTFCFALRRCSRSRPKATLCGSLRPSSGIWLPAIPSGEVARLTLSTCASKRARQSHSHSQDGCPK